jgi:hypothetical protein
MKLQESVRPQLAALDKTVRDTVMKVFHVACSATRAGADTVNNSDGIILDGLIHQDVLRYLYDVKKTSSLLLLKQNDDGAIYLSLGTNGNGNGGNPISSNGGGSGSSFQKKRKHNDNYGSRNGANQTPVASTSNNNNNGHRKFGPASSFSNKKVKGANGAWRNHTVAAVVGASATTTTTATNSLTSANAAKVAAAKVLINKLTEVFLKRRKDLGEAKKIVAAAASDAKAAKAEAIKPAVAHASRSSGRKSRVRAVTKGKTHAKPNVTSSPTGSDTSVDAQGDHPMSDPLSGPVKPSFCGFCGTKLDGYSCNCKEAKEWDDHLSREIDGGAPAIEVGTDTAAMLSSGKATFEDAIRGILADVEELENDDIQAQAYATTCKYQGSMSNLNTSFVDYETTQHTDAVCAVYNIGSSKSQKAADDFYQNTNSLITSVPITLGGHKVLALVDTDSTTSIVKPSFIYKNKLSFVPNKKTFNLAAEGMSVECIGVTNPLTIIHNGLSIEHSFDMFELSYAGIDVFIGSDIMNKLGICLSGLATSWNASNRPTYPDPIISERDEPNSSPYGTIEEHADFIASIQPYLDANAKIPVTSSCTVPESVIRLDTPPAISRACNFDGFTRSSRIVAQRWHYRSSTCCY